ncbi:MAG: SDR family oxidoreductase [Ferrimonas sp.]
MTQTVLITGANRGIGLTFVEHYLQQGDNVIACARQTQATSLQQLQQHYPEQLRLHALDVADPNQLQMLPHALASTRLDVVINNAGIYGPKGLPLGGISPVEFDQVMRTNVLAPLLMVQALRPLLNHHSKIAILSSKMGSIADNSSGGAYFYRASKSAVNAIGVSLARDLASDGIAVALLHPGWVQTDMGGPAALIDTATSVAGMTKVLAQLTLNQSGQFFNYDGSEILW